MSVLQTWPLARMVLGQQQVQGLDYAYTVHGWLKGVNGTNLAPASDMGHDGANGGITARDAFGFALHYFGERDYKPIGAGLHPFTDAESAGSTFKPLFNGNISMMSVNLPKAGEPLLYSYSYDVLNRLVKMDAARNLNTTTNNWEPVALPDYHERISYDPNGNILTYNRNGNPTGTSKPERMDSLTYNYIAGTNKLDNIQDQVAAAAYENDLDAQPLKNYEYDEIGNLTKDSLAGIYKNGIEWTVYGKIKKIVKHTPEGDVTITYNYDPSGNRISKDVNNKVTRYVRDASGNVMSVYVYDDPAVNNGKLSQTEVHLYGSSRLGISTRVTEVENSLALDWATSGGQDSVLNITFARGKKFFELPNHLGNVMATVSDVKRARSLNGSTVDYYEASLVSAQDYYPFGMIQPGRSWNIGNYRYGFNGKENDNEVKGEGNQQDYGMRVYDPRTARWFSPDPVQKKYPNWSPYNFVMNSPLKLSDDDGEDVIVTIGKNSIVFSSTIYVTGPGAADVAKNANSKYGDFTKASLQNRTYKDASGTVYNVQIKMNFVAVNPDDLKDPNLAAYNSTRNDKLAGSGNNILILTTDANRLVNGRANAGHPASGNYTGYNEDFIAGNGTTQTRYVKGVGNMAYLNANIVAPLNAETAIHETFHNFGLGDRYVDNVEYLMTTLVNGIETTQSIKISVGMEGYDGDMMNKGLKFSQTHIDNLSQKALELKKKQGDSFIMAQTVDNSSNSDKSKAPDEFKSGKTVYKKK